ncbi:MAG: hypothetical protein ACOXZM_09680 [Eubacteriales bacterium]|jgi:hypothetical protein
MKKYCVAEGVFSYPLGDNEYAVFNSSNDDLLILNKEAYMLWECIQSYENLDEMIAHSGFRDQCNKIIERLCEKGYIMEL